MTQLLSNDTCGLPNTMAETRRDKIDKLIAQHTQNQPLSANIRKKLSQELNKRDQNGNTLLLQSAFCGDKESVETLIECPLVDVNIQDDESGYSTLHKVPFSLVSSIMFIKLLNRHCTMEIFNSL